MHCKVSLRVPITCMNRHGTEDAATVTEITSGFEYVSLAISVLFASSFFH